MLSDIEPWQYLTVILVMAWGYTVYRVRDREARAERTYPPTGQFIDVGGRRVHAVVLDAKRPDAPDLVLIHGASGNTTDWTQQLAPELSKTYRVIILDRPGLGYTDQRDAQGESITDQAALLQTAAAKLGASRPIVLGHSYGGAVALAWAVNHPDRIAALIPLAAASHPWDSGLPLYYRILSNPVLGPLVIPLITAHVPGRTVHRSIASVFRPDALPKGYLHHFAAALTLRRVSLRANAMQRANLLKEITALAPLYAKISAPTEIVHGTEDALVPLEIHAEPLVRTIPGATLARLENRGHMPHHTAPNEVIAAIHRASGRAGLR